MSWEMVDEGWGRQAVDFATLSEPSNCREYLYLHEYLQIGRGQQLLDVACGAGLSLELARIAARRAPGSTLPIVSLRSRATAIRMPTFV